MNDKTKMILSGVIIVFVLVISFIILLSSFGRGKEDENVYDDNRVIYKNVKYIDVAKTYLSDFISTMYSDLEKAYDMLDDNYKKELGGFDNFVEFADNFEKNNYYNLEVRQFSSRKEKGYRLFYIKDANENTYVFKETSIMNYTVYLSESSVEIQ